MRCRPSGRREVTEESCSRLAPVSHDCRDVSAILSRMTSDAMSASARASRAQFGDIDIYLFDQLLRGRFDERPRVLDAGCGSGRNLPYFLARGFEVYAIDGDAGAAEDARALAAALCARRACGSCAARGDRRAAVARRGDGRRRLQRGPALRARRRALPPDDRRDVARARAGRPVLRAAGDAASASSH